MHGHRSGASVYRDQLTGCTCIRRSVSVGVKLNAMSENLNPRLMHKLGLIRHGVHPKVVQEILGHSEISMTMDTYSHVLPTMQKNAMNELNDIFGE